MKRLPIIAIALTLLCSSLYATAKDKTHNRSQWTQEMLDYKHDFIAEQTEMTQAQREKFMPLYEAMEKEIFAANRTAREQARLRAATSRNSPKSCRRSNCSSSSRPRSSSHDR